MSIASAVATFGTNCRVALHRLSLDDYATTRCCQKTSHECDQHWCIHCGSEITLHSHLQAGHHDGCPTWAARKTLWGWLS